MSIVHIPFYPSDWLAGTRGMMTDETGVYITLIARMYEMAGPIERNDERLYRVCGCNSKRHFVKILKFLIHEGKVQEENGELFHQRVAKEINKVIEKSSKARLAANERWGKKPNKNNAADNADAMQTDMLGGCQSKSEPYKTEAKASTKKRAAQFPEDWMPSEKAIQSCLKKGYVDSQIGPMVEDCIDHHRGKGNTFKDFNAAFRMWASNQIKFHGEPHIQLSKQLNGGSNGQRNNHGQTRGDAQYDEARERALRIGYAGEAPKSGVF